MICLMLHTNIYSVAFAQHETLYLFRKVDEASRYTAVRLAAEQNLVPSRSVWVSGLTEA